MEPQKQEQDCQIEDTSNESCPTTTATDLNSDKRQTRSSATSILCPGLVHHSNGETKLVSDDKAKKFKFPRVAMKFCSNQRIKFATTFKAVFRPGPVYSGSGELFRSEQSVSTSR